MSRGSGAAPPRQHLGERLCDGPLPYVALPKTGQKSDGQEEISIVSPEFPQETRNFRAGTIYLKKTQNGENFHKGGGHALDFLWNR